MAIEEILDLEQIEVNIYRGGVFSPESGFLQRTFGGHVAGQSLVSAVGTVDPKFQVHSLHGYFLRAGDARSPSVYTVERIRDGGSFCTRRVAAIQHGETIFSMSASFQADQRGSSTSGTCESSRGTLSGCAKVRPPSSRCGSGIAIRCPMTTCCTSARWPT
jgi:acyl-CoA thioesterase-2